MASVGHLVVGMAAARLYRTERSAQNVSFAGVLVWSALSFLPDADVVGFALGVRYADEWGHRGATHSLAFSVALGAAIGAAALLVRRPAIRTGVAAGLVLASHAFLDTLTDGGLGCALLWPFDLTRYFAPWTPIPVSPIGFGYLSPYGMYVAAVELLFFAPLMWFAWKPRLGAVVPIVVWLVALWLFLSGDPFRERVVRTLLRDDTVFAQGFSDRRLNSVQRGDTFDAVRIRVGPPMREFLDYDRPDSCGVVRVEGELVADAFPADLCRARGVQPGAPRAIVEALGVPSEHCWLYSRSPDNGYYRARAVCFEDNRVAWVIRRWMRE
jgi:inner membrane protein